MASSIRRVLRRVTRAAAGRRTLRRDGDGDAAWTAGVTRTRPLSLSTQTAAKPTEDDSSATNAPIKFSTSKGGPAAWRVNNSFGSKHQRPAWKPLGISLVFISVLLWSFLRNKTDVDEKLGESLIRLPGLLPEDEDENR